MKLWMVFDPVWSPQWVMIGYSSTLRATLVLAIALLLVRVFARTGAQVRAGIWSVAVAMLLPLPWMREAPVTWRFDALPGWLTLPIAEAGRAMVVQSSPFAEALPWTTLAATAWLAGAVILSAYSALQLWRVRASLRRARPAPDGLCVLLGECAARLGLVRRVGLRISPESLVPFTVGALRPVIVLPERALTWPQTHLRSVLLHELAHVRRQDSATGLLGHCACVLWWFHPGVWLGVRAMCREREHACDAIVLSCGLQSADYAEALLLSAPYSVGRTRSAIAAPMTAGSMLATRIREILSSRPKPVSRFRAGIIAAVMLAMAASVGVMRVAPGSQSLSVLLDSTDWAARAYAAESIARIGGAAEVRQLEQRMTAEPNARVRVHARFGEQLRVRASRDGR
jgi:beta-lactamase regulating signal transducer with metallopeptidase domain